jgi:hypothetical protein
MGQYIRKADITHRSFTGYRVRIMTPVAIIEQRDFRTMSDLLIYKNKFEKAILPSNTPKQRRQLLDACDLEDHYNFASLEVHEHTIDGKVYLMEWK